MHSVIALCAFNHPRLAGRATELGIDCLAIDLETRGKAERQTGFDTAISIDTIEVLGEIWAIESAPLIVRIDGIHSSTPDEIESVIANGADEILIPMVRRPDEVEHVLDLVAGRVGTGIMIETSDAVSHRHALATLPLSRAYVGLNDLWIDRRTRTRFDALVDGTVDSVAEAFAATPFGVAGLTHPDAGFPLPCHLLIDELVRVGADFTFLRRSFFAAIRTQPPADVIAAIVGAIQAAERRTPTEALADRNEFISSIAQLPTELVKVAT